MEMFDETNKYVSLANKYRPQKFEDMVGQENISKTLQNALKLGRIAHAYLFYGPRGCGKTTTARILAKALNCTGNGNAKPTAQPCGQCPQCREIAQSADMDVLELDAASNTQVEKVREAIIDTVALASSRDRFKVFILDEVHMLSTSSFNALLKTIEEPPQHVVFILATTEKHKVPATIVSRCQTFRFRPITVDEISQHLQDLAGAENIDLTPGAAKIIAKNAGGALRDALTLMDRAIAYSGDRIDEKLVGEMLGLTPDELIKQALTALIHKDNAGLHAVFDTLKAEGFDANSFLKDLKNTLGDLFYFSLGQGSEPFEGARQVIDGVSPGFLAQVSRKINKLIDEVKFSDNALISAEVGMFTVMDSCLDIDGFIRRLEALEKGTVLPGGGVSSGGSAPRQSAPKTAAATAKPSTRSNAAAETPVAKTALKTEFAAPKTETPVVSAVKPAVSAPALAASDDVAAMLAADPAEENPEPAPVNLSLAEMAARALAEEEKTRAKRDAVSAAVSGAVSNRQIWDQMLKEFERSPFVYDVMTNCSVNFDGDGWTIGFGKGKEFYRIPAQNKLADLQACASKISGRKITISIANATAPKVVSVTAKAAGAKTPAAEAISDEEPFVKADFSAAFSDDNAVAAADAPEELQDLLNIIPGDVLA